MQGLQNPKAKEIEMKYAAQLEMVRKQYMDQQQQLKLQGKAGLDRYMRARRGCAGGNASSCQMVTGLKAELDRLDQERERLAREEQDVIAELERQKKTYS